MHLLRDLPLLPAIAAYLVVVLAGSVVIRNALRDWIDRPGGRVDANLRRVLLKAVPRPAGAAFFLFAVSVGSRFVPIPTKIESLTKHILPFLFGTLAVVVLMRVILTAISAYGESNPALRSSAGIARALTWIVGLALFAVILSDAMGISLAPALTALGVGSLSVALALQDTLSNFFAGIYLLLDKPIRPGDFIRLDGGQEGYVDSIGWRSTHLRTLAPSTVIVPNATLSKAVITNFRLTNPRLTLGTPIDVGIDAPVETVESLLTEELATIGDVSGVDPTQKPFLRFGFGDRGITFTLYVTVTASADGGLVQQELRRRAITKLKAAEIPLAEPNPFAKKS